MSAGSGASSSGDPRPGIGGGAGQGSALVPSVDPFAGGYAEEAEVEARMAGLRTQLSRLLPAQAVPFLEDHEVDIACAWIDSEGLETLDDIAYFT